MRLLILVLIFVLPGCAVFSAKEAAWPNELKHHDYFTSVYQQDPNNSKFQDLDQYLSWVMSFYQGTELYAKGWNSITAELLHKNQDPEAAAAVQNKMERLGLLISGEWAKNNRTRLITSRHVSIWGNALIKSLEQGETLELLDRVTIDVEDLLARRLAAEAITEDRFYAEEDLFKYIE
jgi:hypothetical protein